MMLHSGALVVQCSSAATTKHEFRVNTTRRRAVQPVVTYSLSKRDVKSEELALLLQECRPVPASANRPQQVQQYSYWRTVPGFHHTSKLDKAVQKSVAVVAVFASVDLYGNSDEDAAASTSMSGVPEMDWNWAMPSRTAQQPRRKRSLVGFGRATGDNTLVATLYDLAVHPEVRGIGIGQRIVKLLVQQLQSRGIYDIGLVAPTEHQQFCSTKCGFEEDREGSTFMTFLGHDRPHDAPLAPALLLEDSSLDNWRKAQESTELRELLGTMLQRATGAAPSHPTKEKATVLGGRGGGGSGTLPSRLLQQPLAQDHTYDI